MGNRLICSAIATVFVVVGFSGANAQSCNSPSGFLKIVGTINIGDLVSLGPDCNSLQSFSLGGGTINATKFIIPNEINGGDYQGTSIGGTIKNILTVSDNSVATDSTRLISAGGSVTIEKSNRNPIVGFLESGVSNFYGPLRTTNGAVGGGYLSLANDNVTSKPILLLSNTALAGDTTRLRSGGGAVTIENSSAGQIAGFLENGQIVIGTITPVSGSLVDLRGSFNLNITNPAMLVPAIGFESNSNLVGLGSQVTLTVAAPVGGAAAVYGGIINQKTGQVVSGVNGSARDSIGAETYGVIGVLSADHNSGSGAGGGFFLRNTTGSVFVPNPALYSGTLGISVGNEATVAASAANASIGIYVFALCAPNSAISVFCVAGPTNDNTFVLGMNILNARDEMIRLGSNASNGYLAPSLIRAYNPDNTIAYDVNNTAQITSKNSTLASTPAAGYVVYWTDATHGRFHDKNSAGTIATTVVADTGSANNFLTAISALGVISKAQPSFANLSGSLTCAQQPAFIGDVTTTVATCANVLATVNANIGSFGSATQVGTFTVNGKGLITAASNVTVTPAVGSITGLGTGVATALAINIGTAGSFVTNGGALGTPSSGTVTNLTGTASININGTVGATTTNTGQFTSITGTGLGTVGNGISSSRSDGGYQFQVINTGTNPKTYGFAVSTADGSWQFNDVGAATFRFGIGASGGAKIGGGSTSYHGDGTLDISTGYYINGTAGITTTCTIAVGNVITFTNGIITAKGGVAGCT